jgi:hypothetical protein
VLPCGSVSGRERGRGGEGEGEGRRGRGGGEERERGRDQRQQGTGGSREEIRDSRVIHLALCLCFRIPQQGDCYVHDIAA